MNTEEFLKKKKMMCESIRYCENCPLSCKNNGKGLTCNELPVRTVIDIVEQMEPDNPINTRQSEFLKIFPDAKMYDIWNVLNLCPRKINVDYVDNKECANMGCLECLKRFWLTEVKGE